MSRYDFLTETYRTERVKTLSVWSQVPEVRMTFRPEPRARTPHEHMVHQCVSEDTWFEEETGFFDVRRSRAWVLTRRFTHSAHHRGQLTVYLRMWGQALYSTYGPTADTGGLFQNQAQVVYRYASIEELVDGERRGGQWPPLPGPGAKSPTERP